MTEDAARRNEAVRRIRDSAALSEALAAQAGLIVAIADAIARAFREGRKVLLFGNGGSAADAEHIAGELAGKFTLYRDPLPAIALTANSSSLTAIANDFSYEEVFARQMRGLMAPGDVVIGLSTSGESANVLKAMAEARERGAVTVAFAGNRGPLLEAAQYVLSVPSSDTPRVQEVHMLAGHVICFLVETALFGGTPPAHQERKGAS